MNPEQLNIEKAKKYVLEARNTIEESAKDALGKLEAALNVEYVESNTKDSLMVLAHEVEVKQTNKQFTAEKFEKSITEVDIPVIPPVEGKEKKEVPHNASAEYIVESVYETKNETLIDGTELLLGTLDKTLDAFALSPIEKQNIKIGTIGYIFDHYYEVLGGIKISDLQNIFTDLTKTLADVKKLGQPSEKGEGVLDSISKKWNTMTGLVSGGSDSLAKVQGFLDNTTKIEDRVTNHLTQKFKLLYELLGKYRPKGKVSTEPDVLTGILSDPENILNFDKRFPAETADQLEEKIRGIIPAGPEKTAEMARKLKTVFENKTAILDKATSTGKNILDTFANNPDTSGPMSWGRDVASGVLKFLGRLPFIGNFIKGLLGIDPSENIDVYFTDERRFQRLSAKNLQSLAESKGSILSGKNLSNVTSKRIAPFTKAYFPETQKPGAKPEEKVTSMSAALWVDIIDKHQISLPRQNKVIEIKEESGLRINDSDFDSNKPNQSFFEKINKLKDLLADKVPDVDSSQTSEKGKSHVPDLSPEGKTKSQIAEMIKTEGGSMIAQYSSEVANMPAGADKTNIQAELKKISDALSTGDVSKIDSSLSLIRAFASKLKPAQSEALKRFDSFITAWKNAPESLSNGDKSVPPKNEKPAEPTNDGSDWKKIASAGLDWLKSKL